MLYHSYHIMAGLGTIFIAIMGLAMLLLWRRKLFEARWRWVLWMLFLAMPFPLIANPAGWFTAEVGRHPWIIFWLMPPPACPFPPPPAPPPPSPTPCLSPS